MSFVDYDIPVEQRFLVQPVRPTRCEQQDIIVYPPTDTLVLSFTMHGAWVLPAFIDVERFCVALAKTLSIFPPIAGRLCKFPDTNGRKGEVYLRLTNSGIPVSVVDDYSTDHFPMEPVLVSPEEFEPWVDPLPSNVINEDEPLFRFRFTKLHKTGQMIYTSCWLHALGDGYMASLVGIYISHFYRGVSITSLPSPSMDKVFFPPPPSDPSTATKFLPLMKHLRDAKSPEELIPLMLESQERTVPITLAFTAKQLATLARGVSMTGPDPASSRFSRIQVLMAYIVFRYNRAVSAVHPGHELIDTVVNTLDYRGNPKFAPTAMFGNAAITLTCPSFTLPLEPDPMTSGPREQTIHFFRCLATIASSIRAGSVMARDPNFLEPYLAFHNDLCRKAYQEGLYQHLLPVNDREITFNSSHQVNWRMAGDLFDTDSEYADAKYTQFHSSTVLERYVRIFNGNPVWREGKNGSKGEWDFTYDGGVEVAFRLDKSIAEVFENAIRCDIDSGFGVAAALL